MVWGSLTRGMSQTRLEVREDRKNYFGILPSFGDLLELIVFDLFFPSKYGDFPVFFSPKTPLGNSHRIIFLSSHCQNLTKKEHTHTHTHLLLEDKPFSFLNKSDSPKAFQQHQEHVQRCCFKETSHSSSSSALTSRKRGEPV